MRTSPSYGQGQIVVILTLVVPALIAAIAFGTDIAVLYTNWSRLQAGADSAVMAGAVYLPENPAAAITTARSFARTCGIRSDEIVSTEVGPDRTTISMKVERKVNFAPRFVGLRHGTVAADSTATVHTVRRSNSAATGQLNASRVRAFHRQAISLGARRYFNA